MHLAILGGSKGDGGLLVTEIPTVACPTLQGIPLLQGHRDAHHLTVGDALRGGDAPTRTHRGGDGAIGFPKHRLQGTRAFHSKG